MVIVNGNSCRIWDEMRSKIKLLWLQSWNLGCWKALLFRIFYHVWIFWDESYPLLFYLVIFKGYGLNLFGNQRSGMMSKNNFVDSVSFRRRVQNLWSNDVLYSLNPWNVLQCRWKRRLLFFNDYFVFNFIPPGLKLPNLSGMRV